MLPTNMAAEHGRTLQGRKTFLQVSSKCSRQPHLSFASRGVRSRPPEEEVSPTTKVETIPLLSPSMESELLKEPWVFPSAKSKPPVKEDSGEFLIWEENFQDLSNWCMDPFQGQYDFPIGESSTLKILGGYSLPPPVSPAKIGADRQYEEEEEYSLTEGNIFLGTKYEGDCASTSEEGGLTELTGVTDEENWSLKMDPTEAFEHLDTGGNAMLPTLQNSAELKQELSGADCSVSDSWLSVPRSSAAAAAPAASATPTASSTVSSAATPTASATATLTSTLSATATASAKSAATAAWSKQNGTEASTSFHPGYHIVDLDLDDACPTPFDSAESQRDTWDVLHTVETTGSDTFDLLSYLCDDEMRSCGSTSTDSVVATNPKSAKTAASSTSTSKSIIKGRIERRNNEPTRRKLESRLAAAMSASSSEISVLPSRRSERTKTQPVVSQPEASCTRERRERYGKKRYIESDSDDQMSTTSSSYRESREKNNEASRKSRMNKKAKENEMALRAVELERDNRILKMKVEELEKLVTSMRNALLRSALKKEF